MKQICDNFLQVIPLCNDVFLYDLYDSNIGKKALFAKIIIDEFQNYGHIFDQMLPELLFDHSNIYDKKTNLQAV